MDASMLGVGVGFDTKGCGKFQIHRPVPDQRKKYVVPDSREGWVESFKLQLESYFNPNQLEYEFDYS